MSKMMQMLGLGDIDITAMTTQMTSFVEEGLRSMQSIDARLARIESALNIRHFEPILELPEPAENTEGTHDVN